MEGSTGEGAAAAELTDSCLALCRELESATAAALAPLPQRRALARLGTHLCNGNFRLQPHPSGMTGMSACVPAVWAHVSHQRYEGACTTSGMVRARVPWQQLGSSGDYCPAALAACTAGSRGCIWAPPGLREGCCSAAKQQAAGRAVRVTHNDINSQEVQTAAHCFNVSITSFQSINE